MTTPFEFGAGTQVGDSFEQDQDELARFELRTYTADKTVEPTSNILPWTHIAGDGVRASLVDGTNLATLSPPAPGLYLMILNLELEAATGTTVTTVKIVSSLGRVYRLWKGTLTTTSTLVNAAVLVPVTVSSGVIEKFTVYIDSASQNVTVSFGSATDGNTFWQLIQMPVSQVPNIVQAIPDIGA